MGKKSQTRWKKSKSASRFGKTASVDIFFTGFDYDALHSGHIIVGVDLLWIQWDWSHNNGHILTSNTPQCSTNKQRG